MFKKNSTVLLSVYLTISVIILSFNLNPTIKGIRNLLFYVVITPYSKVDFAVLSIKNLGSNVKEIIYARNLVLKLKNQNKQLLRSLLKLKTLEGENERLTKLLGYKKKIPRKTTIARIIAKPPQQYYKTIIVDKGSNDGLSENRAVYGFYKGRFGVVGQLTNVGKNISQVLVITNRISKIPARVLPAKVDGIIVGREANELEMLWIPGDASIKIGDKVISSSISDIFPTGIPIGMIVAISRSGHLPFKSAKVKMAIPVFQLTDVFIE